MLNAGRFLKLGPTPALYNLALLSEHLPPITACKSSVMSGFEVAGVVLGAFPVALEGLKFAVDSMQTMKEWHRYRLKLQDYANMLATAHCFYCDTLDELWGDIVESEEMLNILEANPGGSEWQSPVYNRRLKERLGRSYDSYIQNVITIHQHLEYLSQSLGIEENGKVTSLPRSWTFDVQRFCYPVDEASTDLLSDAVERLFEPQAAAYESEDDDQK